MFYHLEYADLLAYAVSYMAAEDVGEYSMESNTLDEDIPQQVQVKCQLSENLEKINCYVFKIRTVLPSQLTEGNVITFSHFVSVPKPDCVIPPTVAAVLAMVSICKIFHVWLNKL